MLLYFKAEKKNGRKNIEIQYLLELKCPFQKKNCFNSKFKKNYKGKKQTRKKKIERKKEDNPLLKTGLEPKLLDSLFTKELSLFPDVPSNLGENVLDDIKTI